MPACSVTSGGGGHDGWWAVQACAGLPETGVADRATWEALLGPELKPIDPPLEEGEEGAEGGSMAASSEESAWDPLFPDSPDETGNLRFRGLQQELSSRVR